MTDRMDAFLEYYSEPLPENLLTLREEAIAAGIPIVRPQMQNLLRFLMKTVKPNRILEIGTAVGFSSLLMAHYAPQETQITTIENYEPRLEQARKNLASFPEGKKIRLMEGDALELLPSLEEPFDFLFMDAAKGQYLTMMSDCKRLVKNGGLLLADNCLQEGEVLESRFAVRRRDRTIHARMREFLYEISRDPDWESCILPLADGIVLAQKQ